MRRRKLCQLFFTAKPRGSNPAQQMTFKRWTRTVFHT
jgi:hypothetical protein